MKVNCTNGFYRFYPENVGELRVWAEWNTPLAKRDNYYTFPLLAAFPDYSFKGRQIGLYAFTKNYAGAPWEVLRANNLTYDVAANDIRPAAMVTDFLSVDNGLIINTPILPQAYSVSGTLRVTGFSGYWDSDFNVFKLEEVQYESFSSQN